jgi:hypothetical protein
MTGWVEYNHTRREHALSAVGLSAYLRAGHPWEALFENWESEVLQMAAFVILTACSTRRDRQEIARRRRRSRTVRVGPRDTANREGVPWPVKRGGLPAVPRAARAGAARVRWVQPVLVRVASKLAKRVSVRWGDGVAGGLPATARIAGVQTRSCSPLGDWALSPENRTLQSVMWALSFLWSAGDGRARG